MSLRGKLMSTVETDYLVEYLAHAPVALGLLRAIECRTLAALEFEHPILDVGCGDGLFGQVFFRDGVDVGWTTQPRSCTLRRKEALTTP
jgi:2-polyprenyl-3-methyl-5-hydroxy-6-metoxy-1,4-benzoquinol methylase